MAEILSRLFPRMSRIVISWDPGVQVETLDSVLCYRFSSFFLGRPWLRYAFGEKGGPKRDAMPAVFLATNIGYALTFSLQYILLR